MSSTSYWPRSGKALWDDKQFDELRAAYLKRMRSDRERLIDMRVRLMNKNTNPAVSREEIRLAAHRMAGAAAIFESREELINTSITLEQAAYACMKGQSAERDEKLLLALEGLLGVLAIECAAADGG